jgi:hypothetical protein
MRVEWPKDMTVMVEVACGVLAGGLTAQQRTSLAERVGISEEVLLRYERARQACHDLIFRKQVNQAWGEAAHRMRELGKSTADPAFLDELEQAVHRIRRATPENDVKRERDEALAAVRAAIAASKETKASQGDDSPSALPVSNVNEEIPTGALSGPIGTERGSIGARERSIRSERNPIRSVSGSLRIGPKSERSSSRLSSRRKIPQRLPGSLARYDRC